MNLKVILLWFEQISGMRVNFHKSELIPMNLSDMETHDLSHFFACPVGSLPIKYLGIPLHYDNLRREDIQPLVDKIKGSPSARSSCLCRVRGRVRPLGSFVRSLSLHFYKRLDKMLKRIAGWRGKLLSYAARLVLIKACLASIPVYLLSFIKFPKWAIRILHTHMANCLWNDNPEAHKYYLVN